MMERFVVIISTQVIGTREVEVEAEDISIDDTGVRLYVGNRCVAYFCDNIFRGVYRKISCEECEVVAKDD